MASIHLQKTLKRPFLVPPLNTYSYLAEIIAQENSTSEELLKKLIYQHWQTLKPRQTLAQRRGGHPKNLLQDAAPDSSLRENRKQIINARTTTR
ncbi:MAG: hypothetical protein ACK466_22385 [Pseudanabaena sp.]